MIKKKKKKKISTKKMLQLQKVLAQRKKVLGLLLRINTFGSLDSMMMEIYKWPKEKFRFLNLFFSIVSDIRLMSNLLPIMRFSLKMMEIFNHKISRTKAKEMPMAELLA